MVDSIKGSNPVQSIQSTVKAPFSKEEKRAAEAKNAAAPVVVDEVNISREALDLAQVEQAVRDVRSELQKDLDRVLGIDPSFAEQVEGFSA